MFSTAFLSDAFLAFLGAPCLTMTFVASCVGLRSLLTSLQTRIVDLFVVCHAPRVLTCLVFSYVLCWKILCSGKSVRVLSELLESLSASSPEALSTLKFIVLPRAMHLSCLSAGPFWGLKHGWTEGHTAGAQIGSCGSGNNFTCKCSRKSWPLHLRLDHHT